MPQEAKVILTTRDPNNLILALRATEWLRKQPITQRDALLAYGELGGATKVYIYVKRGKCSLIAKEIEG